MRQSHAGCLAAFVARSLPINQILKVRGRKMTFNESISLPVPAFAGGTKAITMTPVVGTPHREYAQMFSPGDEKLEDGEIRVTVLGSGNPWPTRAQALASVLVEVGNPERTSSFSTRTRRHSELDEHESAGERSQQGIHQPSAHRPHRRFDHAHRQLVQDQAC